MGLKDIPGIGYVQPQTNNTFEDGLYEIPPSSSAI